MTQRPRCNRGRDMGVARYCKFVDLAPIRQSIQALLIVLTRENRDHEFQKPLSAVVDLHFESVGLLSRLVDSCRVFWLETPQWQTPFTSYCRDKQR